MTTLADMIVAALTNAMSESEQPDMNREEALAAICDPETDAQSLVKILRLCPGSLEVARAVARHPNLDQNLLANMFAWLPEDAAKNPAVARYSEDENWVQRKQRHLDQGLGTTAD